jgi:hypothetical protein
MEGSDAYTLGSNSTVALMPSVAAAIAAGYLNDPMETTQVVHILSHYPYYYYLYYYTIPITILSLLLHYLYYYPTTRGLALMPSSQVVHTHILSHYPYSTVTITVCYPYYLNLLLYSCLSFMRI